MVIQANLPAVNQASIPATFTKPLAQLGAIDTSSANPSLDVSSTMDAQLNSLNTAQGDVANSISFTQTQGDLLQNIGTALDRMDQLATAAQSPSATSGDRATLNHEFKSLSAYITKAAGSEFNGVSLFSANPLSVNADANGGSSSLPGVNLQSPVYTAATSSDISTIQGSPAGGATAAQAAVQAALKQLSADSSTVGTNQTQLNSVSDYLAISSENLTAASSNLTTLDAAQQSTAAAANSMLNQPALALLAQSNQSPQTVLSLLEQ